MFLRLLISRIPGITDEHWEKIVETFSISPDARKEAEEATKKMINSWNELTGTAQKEKMIELGIPSEIYEKWKKEIEAERR
jgi:hypothetical protein